MFEPKPNIVRAVLLTAIFIFPLGFVLGGNSKTSESNAVNVSAGTNSDAESDSMGVRGLSDIWEKLNENYFDASKLDRSKLDYSAIKGFVAGIGDPYTVFMTPEENKEFDNDLEGKLEGIGALLEAKEGKLVVVSPVKKSPAEKAGLKAGDVIYKIEDKFADEMTLYDAVRMIRGKKGTAVTLTIVRENMTTPLELKITREEIVIDSITTEKVGDGILHLSLNQFNEHTSKEYENAIQKILLEKPRGLIFDLRGNGGGYLEVSVEILSELFTGEKTAAIIKRRGKENEFVKTSGGGRLADIPLVVLVDKGSASASEIVAGAIQDYKRGVVIGETTFGKGSVQELMRFNDESVLRYTIAKWFTPLDRTIDKVGVTPDREVKITEEDVKSGKDPQLAEAVKYLEGVRK